MPAYTPNELRDPHKPVYNILVWKPHLTLEYWTASIVSDEGDDIQATGPGPRQALLAALDLLKL